MKKLHLNLTEEWFNMILSGEKKEEYREIKPHYISQLFHWQKLGIDRESFCAILIKDKAYRKVSMSYLKEFESIVFSNGYKIGRKQFEMYFSSIEIEKGFEKWGAVKDEIYFCFQLGPIISKNF